MLFRQRIAHPDASGNEAPVYLQLLAAQEPGNAIRGIALHVAQKKQQALPWRQSAHCLFQVCAAHIAAAQVCFGIGPGCFRAGCE